MQRSRSSGPPGIVSAGSRTVEKQAATGTALELVASACTPCALPRNSTATANGRSKSQACYRKASTRHGSSDALVGLVHDEKEPLSARIIKTLGGTLGASMLEEVAFACSAAFEDECPKKCREAVSVFCRALDKVAIGALRSGHMVSACALFSSLLVHPKEKCRKAALKSASRELNMLHFLRAMGQGVGGKDLARKWQVIAGSLRSSRLIVASKPDALERFIACNGIDLVLDLWKIGRHAGDVVLECCLFVLVLGEVHGRTVALGETLDYAVNSFKHFHQDTSRGPLIQSLIEVMLALMAHVSFKPPELAQLSVVSLRAYIAVGPALTINWLLRLNSHLVSDARTASELMSLGIAELCLLLISDGRWHQEAQLRRLAAEVYVWSIAAAISCNSVAHKQPRALKNATTPQLQDPLQDALPSADSLQEASINYIIGAESTLSPSESAAALKSRLCAWKSRAQRSVGNTTAAVDMCNVAPLQFDADFASGSLGSVARLGPREYDITLQEDCSKSGTYVQWFCFRIRQATSDQTYTFHLTNLIKGSSLFGDGCQPVMFSRQRHEAAGVGWTRIGTNIAYYPIDTGKNYCVSFDAKFPCNEDDIFIAHAVPYTHSDLIRDIARWPSVSRSLLTKSISGRSVDALSVGDPSCSRHVCIIARAHPGETNASWLMRGVLDTLVGGSTEADLLLRKCQWFLVPMLNPDGVATGRTRTNLNGLDLNRHHHDDLAAETCGLRAALMRETERDKVQAFVFVDIHSHSRRRGIYAITNGNDADPLVDCLGARSELVDVAGTDRRVARHEDEGVGRVAASKLGYKYSLTLESSMCARHWAAGGQHISLKDLQSVGRALCWAIGDLADKSVEESASPDVTSERTTFLEEEESLNTDAANVSPY